MKKLLCMLCCCVLLTGCSKAPDTIAPCFLISPASIDDLEVMQEDIKEYINASGLIVFQEDLVLNDAQNFGNPEVQVKFGDYYCKFPCTLSKLYVFEKEFKNMFTQVNMVYSPEYVLSPKETTMFISKKGTKQPISGTLINNSDTSVVAKDCTVETLYTDNISVIELPGMTIDTSTCTASMLIMYWGIPYSCWYESGTLSFNYKFDWGI